MGMDYILGGKVHGELAQKLLQANFDPGVLRPWEENGKHWAMSNGVVVPTDNATLRKDEWKHYDDAIQLAARTRLTCAQKFIDRGLTYTIPNGLGKMVFEYEDMNDFSDASIGMDPMTPSNEEKAKFELKYLPMPVIWKEFRLNIRQLQASRETGQALDTTQAEMAARVVAEKVETITCNGASSFAFGGGTLYGLKDFTHATTGSLTADWDDSAATGATIVADVIAMKQAAINDRHYGPFGIFIPTNYETILDENYSDNYPGTIRDRILAIQGIEFVEVADTLTADYVVMVQLTQDTMRMVVGLPLTTIQWESRGGLGMHFLVMTIMVPQPRADQNNRSGIVVYN